MKHFHRYLPIILLVAIAPVSVAQAAQSDVYESYDPPVSTEPVYTSIDPNYYVETAPPLPGTENYVQTADPEILVDPAVIASLTSSATATEVLSDIPYAVLLGSYEVCPIRATQKTPVYNTTNKKSQKIRTIAAGDLLLQAGDTIKRSNGEAWVRIALLSQKTKGQKFDFAFVPASTVTAKEEIFTNTPVALMIVEKSSGLLDGNKQRISGISLRKGTLVLAAAKIDEGNGYYRIYGFGDRFDTYVPSNTLSYLDSKDASVLETERIAPPLDSNE